MIQPVLSSQNTSSAHANLFCAHASQKVKRYLANRIATVVEAVVHLLIPYVPLLHADPVLDEFTYGDVGARARKLKRDVRQGDYVFLHTTLRGGRYVTAYYVVDKVLDTSEAAANKAIALKYRNPHIKEYLAGERREDDDVIIFGDTVLSLELKRPLPFDKKLADKLSLEIPFKNGFTENQCISSATRAWRELTENDVKILQSEIERSEKEGFSHDTILSTDEVLEILEVDLENFITRNSRLIGSGLVSVGRQIETPVGRIDLLFEDKNGTLIVVELKLNQIGTGALNQLRGYMNYCRTNTNKNVRGVLVCKDVLPTFVDKFKNLPDIQILCFGWKLTVYPRKWD